MNSGGIRKFELGGNSMENDYTSFIEKNEDGSIKSFDESKLSSYIDSLVSKGVNAGVESYKSKIAKDQEREKMTADEKLADQMKEFEKLKADWETTRKSQMRDIVVEKAKAKLASNFSESEIELFTKHITDNEKESMEYVESLVAERVKFLEESKKKIIEELQSKQPQSTTQSNAKDDSGNQQPVKRTAQEIKEFYLK